MSAVYLGANATLDILTDVHVYLGMMVDRQFNSQKKPLLTFHRLSDILFILLLQLQQQWCNVFLIHFDKTAYKFIKTQILNVSEQKFVRQQLLR